MRAQEVRRIALALPEAFEADHHGFPSFRVVRRIFATMPDSKHLNVMLGEEQIRRAVAEAPQVCEAVWWGRRLAGVRVDLEAANARLVAPLLRAAWERVAPRRLVHPRRP